MNEFAKTGLYLGGAAAVIVLAFATRPGGISNLNFDDEGKEFFEDFKDPGAAAELLVWQFDKERSSLEPFDVKREDNGLWTIPSHSNYPADAKTRMAKAATMLIGLKRDRVISDLPDDYAKFSVIDPLDESAKVEGRGTHVTIKDRSGSVLADLIIGNAVEGKTGMRYVRLPGIAGRPAGKRVYSAKMDVDLSTKFADWIERDLLKASSYDISEVIFDNYKVDEEHGQIVKGDIYTVKKDDASKWTLNDLAATEDVNEEKLREITDTLTQLKIVGVRPKPPGITADLSQATGFDREILLRSLMNKGFFPTRDGKLFADEGDLTVHSKKGVVYTLKFGQIAYGEGEAVSSGKDEGKPKDPKESAASNHRYLMITAQFDESLLQKPTKLRLTEDQLKKRKDARDEITAIVKAIDAYKAAHDKKLPDSLKQLTEGDKPELKELKKDPWEQDYVLEPVGDAFAVVSYGEDKKAGGEGADADVRNDKFAFEDELTSAATDWKAYDKKVEDGRKEADNLTKRFGPWYYVIDAASFTKLRPARKDLVKEKPPAKPADAASTGKDEKKDEKEGPKENEKK